jgi:hypothetical protein
MDEVVKKLNESANSFIETVSKVKLYQEVYENGWSAKQIIAHIVFYHEYYASVIRAMVKDRKLPLIDESLAVVNKRSAVEYGRLPRKELLKRFEKANGSLSKNIVQLDVNAEIPYKKGGRRYTPNEYIREITRHIEKHTKDLRRRNVELLK